MNAELIPPDMANLEARATRDYPATVASLSEIEALRGELATEARRLAEYSEWRGPLPDQHAEVHREIRRLESQIASGGAAWELVRRRMDLKHSIKLADLAASHICDRLLPAIENRIKRMKSELVAAGAMNEIPAEVLERRSHLAHAEASATEAADKLAAAERRRDAISAEIETYPTQSDKQRDAQYRLRGVVDEIRGLSEASVAAHSAVDVYRWRLRAAEHRHGLGPDPGPPIVPPTPTPKINCGLTRR